MSEASKPKWTPGPWRITGEGTIRAGDRNVANSWIARVYWGNKSSNAHLIAAAPELAEALADIIEQFEATRFLVGPDLADSIRVFGKQALAKARGEQS